MKINRRRFMQAMGTGIFCPAVAWGQETKKNDIFISCAMGQDKNFHVGAFDRNGRKKYSFGLPDRAHAIETHPHKDHAVIFARRPDTFATVFDIYTGRVLHMIRAGAGYHFYGHGSFSPDGSILFSAEKNINTGAGVLGVRDANDGYKVLGYIDAGGIGPHETAQHTDGKTLIVAVGGIQTHGRKKVNLKTMQPSLNYIDMYTGKVISKHMLPKTDFQLSIRHMDVLPNGAVVFACQNQDKSKEAFYKPLVGIHSGQDNLTTISNIDMHTLEQHKGYCGSVKSDISGQYFSVSSPRGNVINIWSVKAQKIIDTISYVDSCGVAPTGRVGEFMITSGSGGCAIYNAIHKNTAYVDTPFTVGNQWDNHLTYV